MKRASITEIRKELEAAIEIHEGWMDSSRSPDNRMYQNHLGSRTAFEYALRLLNGERETGFYTKQPS